MGYSVGARQTYMAPVQQYVNGPSLGGFPSIQRAPRQGGEPERFRFHRTQLQTRSRGTRWPRS
ncbi:hypothetical protein B0F90DRAFT_1755338 [Multifurca ochricompacta]|uniref:Uncharacterized protein n=1 Tax=Multifurca ochricompacta TaxID=376703 RepID=A0AAD4QJF0_9AGAM|nr:hypothetical protein B0F90DRAFT_1755338 [Multifurca ochricompacta]